MQTIPLGTHNSSRLLDRFDRSVERGKGALVARYGDHNAESLIRDSRQEYEGLIPQIPDIGNRSPFLRFLLPATRYLAIYRAVQKQGGALEDAGALIYDMSEAEFRAMPRFARRMIGSVWFSRWFRKRLKKQAAETQLREYPEGYVLSYVEGDGQSFDYGVDYTECGGCKFLSAQGATELAPYLCAVDKVASEMLGWGLTRTTTLAEGGARCDFRFKKGGETHVAGPTTKG